MGGVGRGGEESWDKKTNKLSRWFLPFVLELCYRFRELLAEECDVDALIAGGETLIAWMDVCNREGRHMSRDGVLALVRLANEHMDACTKLDMHLKPKHHMASFSFARADDGRSGGRTGG